MSDRQASVWEDTFRRWAQAPSQTEQTKMENAESAVRGAIDASSALNHRDIRVFAQGSYRNRTNIRKESDVDICVLCKDSYYFTLPEGYDRAYFGLNAPATYHDAEFRRDVEQALIARFGAATVSSGNKAWDIHENSYRVDADVVAAFGHWQYFPNSERRTGIAVLPKAGWYILNYPEQNYQNGKARNDATGKRYRAVVRILKNLWVQMKDDNKTFPELPSFLNDCLVYNVPLEAFGHTEITDDVRWVLAHLRNETRVDDSCQAWVEVNECKYLFHSSQKWTREQVNSALYAAWRYIGFE